MKIVEIIKNMRIKRKHKFDCDVKMIESCEDPNTLYMEMPDGLRLVIREGKYVGWYLPQEECYKG